MTKAITFNSFSLQDTNWRTKDIIYRNLPVRSLDTELISRGDGFRLINAYYTSKDITVSGTVTADTEAALRILVDNMKKALYTTEANLDITDGSTTLRWVATVSNISVPEEHYHITRIPYSITFRCQPIATSTASVTDTNSIVNTSSDTDTVVITGSIAPKPVIRWTVSGAPSSAITAIQFANTTSGDTIAVSGLVLNGNTDYLEIDTDNMTVVYNTGSGEVDIDFTGVFPSFVTSTNSYTVTITGGGASKTLNQTIVYYPSYL